MSEASCGARNTRLFAAFSLEKEESSFFEKKEAKQLLFLRRFVGFGSPPSRGWSNARFHLLVL
jgi:hypothetical protein